MNEFYRTGKIKMAQDNYDSALNDLLRAYKDEPDNLDLIYDIAYCYFGILNYNASYEFLERGLEIDEYNTDFLQRKAYLLIYKRKMYQEGIYILDKLLNLNNNNLWAHYYMGYALRRLNEFEEAYGHLMKVIDEHTDPVYIACSHIDVAIMLHLSKREDDALENLKKAESFNPKNDYIHYLRGVFLFEAGKHNDSVRHFKKAFKMDKKNADASFYIADCCYRLGKYSDAIKYADISIKIENRSDEYFYFRGKIYLKLKEYSYALGDTTKAVQLAPQCDLYYEQRTEIYYCLGEYKKAVDDSDTALIINKDNLNVRYYAAMSKLKLCYYKDAIEDFNEIEKRDLKYLQIYRARATCYYQTGDLEKALKDLDKSIKNENNVAECYYQKGLIYEKQNKPEISNEYFIKSAVMGDSCAQKIVEERGLGQQKIF